MPTMKVREDDFDHEEEEDHTTTTANHEAADAPSALVQKDTTRVAILRVLLGVILAVSAVLSSYYAYSYTLRAEVKSYRDNFQSLSERIVETYLINLYQRFQLARGLAASVKDNLLLQQVPSHKLSLVPSSLQELTLPLRIGFKTILTTYSPILVGDQQRLEFEEFASNTTFLLNPNPQCFYCGDASYKISNPTTTYFVPGYGYAPCGAGEALGLSGGISAGACPYVVQQATVVGDCRCEKRPEGEVPLSNLVMIPEQVFSFENGTNLPVPYTNDTYVPVWQTSGFGELFYNLMFDQLSEPVRADAIREVTKVGIATMTGIISRNTDQYKTNRPWSYIGLPATVLYVPVVDRTGSTVGLVSLETSLEDTFPSGMPPLSELLNIYFEDSCGTDLYKTTFSHETDKLGNDGIVSSVEPPFDDTSIYSSSYEAYVDTLRSIAGRVFPEDYNVTCMHRIHITAKEDLWLLHFKTNTPIIAAIITFLTFIVTSAIFVLYDRVVLRRQEKVMDVATKTTAIVSNMFPETFRQKLYVDQANMDDKDAPFVNGKEFIAELYPDVTVMVFNIIGFSSWSSERDATQIFQLLEGLFSGFDTIARGCGAFKIESVGDRYIAVCGLPRPRKNHASIMARFSKRCLQFMARKTRDLEIELGPSTADLRARIGLHSGPVTAGVLRGEKARLQLFGNTVDMAARIEAAGHPFKIHCTKAFAEQLEREGRGSWAEKCKEPTMVRGKGVMETFFVKPGRAREEDSQASHTSLSNLDDNIDGLTGALSGTSDIDRLVEWNAHVLYSLLQNWVCNRAAGVEKDPEGVAKAEHDILERPEGCIVIREFSPVLQMPAFSPLEDIGDCLLPASVQACLHSYVSEIAKLYRNVPFHNFAHASHVIMSCAKLMKRIVNPDGKSEDQSMNPIEEQESLYKSTYGISGYPLMLFAATFSALIHDVDHTGLSNAELIKMGANVAKRFQEKSVAEQNSIDLAWTLLMEDRFRPLREAIYCNVDEFHRFRQLIVNAVCSTDIADRELKLAREKRWDIAFGEASASETDQDLQNRKATITYEYIVQASDVCHMLQHWDTYQRFNGRLFEERYKAYIGGHMEKDPSLGWFGGELWFFDNYVLPCAVKLKKCGVFGVTYAEFVDYGKENRRLWEQNGKAIVEKLRKEMEEKYSTTQLEV